MNAISTAAPNTLLADEAQPGMAWVRAFYRDNHAQQTYAYCIRAGKESPVAEVRPA